MTEQNIREIKEDTILEEEVLMETGQTNEQVLVGASEVTEGKMGKLTKFIKKHKVAIGATLVGVAVGVTVANKANKPKTGELEILEGDFEEIAGEFKYDEGYSDKGDAAE